MVQSSTKTSVKIVPEDGTCKVDPGEISVEEGDTVEFSNKTDNPIVIMLSNSMILNSESTITIEADSTHSVIVKEGKGGTVDCTVTCNAGATDQSVEGEPKAVKPVIIIIRY